MNRRVIVSSRVFEKLILKQILYLESKNKLVLTGKQQHGFKKNKSTATEGTLLQPLISRPADENCYVLQKGWNKELGT